MKRSERLKRIEKLSEILRGKNLTIGDADDYMEKRKAEIHKTVYDESSYITNLMNFFYKEVIEKQCFSLNMDDYDYKTNKIDIEKRDLNSLFSLTRYYSRAILGMPQNDDVIVTVQFQDLYFSFVELYLPTMPVFVKIEEKTEEAVITFEEMVTQIQASFPEKELWTDKEVRKFIF